MPKLVLATIAMIFMAASLPAAAQQSGQSHQSTAGQSVTQGNDGNAQRRDNETSFKFTQKEIRQMQHEIRQAQQALGDKGYTVGKVDGVLGHRTAQALRKFQRQQGIPATGRIDGQTASALGLPSLANQLSGKSERQPSTTGKGSREHPTQQSPAAQGR